MKKIIGAIAVWAVMAIGAQAQLSLDDIEAALDGAAGELQRVDEILAHPDANRRLAGMELLLNSGNPPSRGGPRKSACSARIPTCARRR